MQEFIVIAGSSGAGKTSFANEYLSSFRGRFVFLNADEIAREIASPDMPQTRLDLRAGREMLTRTDDCIDAVDGSRDVRAGRFVGGDASVSLPRSRPRPRRLRSKAGSHIAEKRKG